MKAITLYEPFASLMAIGAKANETRPMRANHRGDICIHAAKSRKIHLNNVAGAAEAMKRIDGFLSFNWGCIIAVVDLWDIQPSHRFVINAVHPGFLNLTEEEESFGNYEPLRWIYRTRNLRRLKTPIPCKGFQCVGWTVPANIEKEVLKQLSEF